MKVDITDETGNRYTVTFAGNVTRDKAVRLLEIVDLLGGMPENNNFEPTIGMRELSKFDKVKNVVEKHFPIVWFSSRNIQAMCERELSEPISLSTVSTYLSRLVEQGLLVKSGSSCNLRYRTVAQMAQNVLNLKKGNK